MATATEPAPAAPAAEERKTKQMKPDQTNCDEKDAKNKPCWGQLKMWLTAPETVKKQVPSGAQLYRCQVCLTVYYGPPRALPLKRVPRRVSILGW
jgi:hypothetical protein